MQPAHMTEKTLCLQGGERRDTEQYAENGGTMEVRKRKRRSGERVRRSDNAMLRRDRPRHQDRAGTV